LLYLPIVIVMSYGTYFSDCKYISQFWVSKTLFCKTHSNYHNQLTTKLMQDIFYNFRILLKVFNILSAFHFLYPWLKVYCMLNCITLNNQKYFPVCSFRGIWFTAEEPSIMKFKSFFNIWSMSI